MSQAILKNLLVDLHFFRHVRGVDANLTAEREKLTATTRDGDGRRERDAVKLELELEKDVGFKARRVGRYDRRVRNVERQSNEPRLAFKVETNSV